MKIAAVNFEAHFADVEENLKKASALICQASAQGIDLILFPEFFTSSMGFSDKMLDVAICSAHVDRFLQNASAQYRIIIGGSYLYFDGNDAYNLFQLVFPDGRVYTHKKDIPTISENCYYTQGDTNHILRTPIGDIGIALCWEMVRYDTLRRLAGKVDLVLAGTCWADLPDFPGGAALKQYNRSFARKTPAVFASLLRVPVIHSNHCGQIRACDYPNQIEYTLQMVGATQIINARGEIVSERTFEQGEGMITIDHAFDAHTRKPLAIEENKYWIEELPEAYSYAWEVHGASAREYYQRIAKPHYKAYGLFSTPT